MPRCSAEGVRIQTNPRSSSVRASTSPSANYGEPSPSMADLVAPSYSGRLAAISSRLLGEQSLGCTPCRNLAPGSGRQRRFDCGDYLGRVGRRLRGEPGATSCRPARPGTSRSSTGCRRCCPRVGRRGQRLVQRMPTGTVDVHLLGHRERHAVAGASRTRRSRRPCPAPAPRTGCTARPAR